MLKTQLLHPQLLSALASAGHGSKILIADGNYPFSTKLGPRAQLISLNLSPGVVSCTQTLQALLSAIPVEAAAVMDYARTGPYALSTDPPIWNDFRSILQTSHPNLNLNPIERFAFYEQASQSDVALTIATADQRIYANLLLTIGVVLPS